MFMLLRQICLDFRLEMVTPELSKQGVAIIFHYHILPSLNRRNGFVGICLDRAHGKKKIHNSTASQT
jgi:hypothetical protein